LTDLTNLTLNLDNKEVEAPINESEMIRALVDTPKGKPQATPI
jgi:hypothetical protein